MSKQSQRNHAIEMLRFLCSLEILLFHVNKYVLKLETVEGIENRYLMQNGAICVEFFFLLSGMLMARTVDSQQRKYGDSADLGKDTLSFVWNKIKRILPCHLTAFVFVFAAYAFVNIKSLGGVVGLMKQSAPNLLLLQYSGIPGRAVNHIEWYISAMLISLAILYPLCRRNFSLFTRVIAPVGSILIIGYLGSVYGKLSGVSVWTGLVNKGVLRALGECALGASLYLAAATLSKKQWTAGYRLLLTIVEAGCYIFALRFAVLSPSNTELANEYEFYVLGLFAVGITLTFSNITYSGKIVPEKASLWLGKLSLPVYLFQLFGIYLAPALISDPNGAALFAVVSSLVVAVLYQITYDAITGKSAAAG